LIKSKLFVLTSKFEGHPMILLEAMAMKVIPIVISYPGANEYIVHGKTGFIEKDEQALAKRIIKLLNNHQLRQQISNQTRNQAIKIYNSSLIDKTLKLALNKS